MTTTTRLPAGVYRRRAFGVAGAVLAALAVWVIAVPVLGVELAVRTVGGQIQGVDAVMVVATALVASLAGWTLLAVLERATARARTIWTATAAVVLLASLLPPATTATSAGSAVTLVVLHLVVGAVLIAGLAAS